MRLAACASFLMVACAPAFAGQVKWVPLDQVGQESKQKPVATPPVASSTLPVPDATPAPAPVAKNLMEAAPRSAPSVVAVAPTSASVQQPLQITCFGAGVANKPTVATAYSSGSFSGLAGTSTFSGSGNGSTTIYGRRQQGFGDQVDVRLFSGDDRIRMPRTMLPGLHGGDHGWFKLKNIVADARSIRAKAAVNFLNNPNVFIDRVTGTISISGKSGDYSGQCQAVEASAPAKF